LGFGRFVAECEEGKKSVLGVTGHGGGGAWTTWGRPAREGIEGRKFVAEFEHDPLCGFFSKAFEFGEGRGIA
jgi:hypothetical protein